MNLFREPWVPGPTGGRVPASIAQGLTDVRNAVPADAAANGMHAWHAGSNAYLAGEYGLAGFPLVAIAGLFHESPLDWNSFMAEQTWQGTINHALDSATDLIGNGFGLAIGYTLPRDAAVPIAIRYGNHIPGPGEPDPAFGGLGGPYRGNPSDAWGQYPR